MHFFFLREIRKLGKKYNLNIFGRVENYKNSSTFLKMFIAFFHFVEKYFFIYFFCFTNSNSTLLNCYQTYHSLFANFFATYTVNAYMQFTSKIKVMIII